MPNTLAQLDAAIADIKTTTSGEIEWNDNAGSMKTVIAYMRNLIQQGTIIYCTDIDEMKALTGAQAQFAHVCEAGIGVSAGLYSYRAIGATAPNDSTSFASADGGVWRQVGIAG